MRDSALPQLPSAQNLLCFQFCIKAPLVTASGLGTDMYPGCWQPGRTAPWRAVSFPLPTSINCPSRKPPLVRKQSYHLYPTRTITQTSSPYFRYPSTVEWFKWGGILITHIWRQPFWELEKQLLVSLLVHHVESLYFKGISTLISSSSKSSSDSVFIFPHFTDKASSARVLQPFSRQSRETA